MLARRTAALCAALSLMVAAAAHAQVTFDARVLSGTSTATGVPLSAFRALASDRGRYAAFHGHTDALMAWTGGSLVLLAQTGTPLPAPLAGSFNTFFDPANNDNDAVAFRARTNSTSVDEGVFLLEANGTLTHVSAAVVGRPERTPVEINNANAPVVAWQNRTGGTRQLLRWAGGVNTIIADSNTPSPGGGTLRRFGDFAVVGDGGHVAFVADVNGGDDGIFVWDPVAVTITALALEGGPAPLTGTYDGFSLDQHIAINAAGNVAFSAEINGGANNVGVFVYNFAAGTTSRVAADGDVVSGAFTTLSDVDDDYVGINAAGEVGFKGVFGSGAGALTHLVEIVAGLLQTFSPPLFGEDEFPPRYTSGGRTVWLTGSTIVEESVSGVATNVILDATTPTPLGLGVRPFEPSMNDLGDVVFTADHSKLNFVDGTGPADEIAEIGDPSPAPAATQITGLRTQGVDRRSVAFVVLDDAPPIGIGVAQAIGWTRQGTGNIDLVVATNTAAPAAIGGVYTLGGGTPLAVRGRRVYFMSDVLGGSVANGLFRGRRGAPGNSRAVLVEGDASSVTGDPFDRFDAVGELRRQGRDLLFRADLLSGRSGIFIASDRTNPNPIAVALEGDPAPGTAGNFQSFGRIDFNRQRRVIFTAEADTGEQGVFYWDGATVTPVAVDGDPAPLIPTGVFDHRVFDVLPIGIGRGDRMVFGTAVEDASNTLFETLYSAVPMAGGPVVLTLEALNGTPTPIGGTFRAFNQAEPMGFNKRVGMAGFDLSLAGAEHVLFRLRF